MYFFSPLLPLPLLFSCVLLRRESFTVDCGTTVERRDGSDPHPVGFVLTAGGAQRSRLPPPPAERTGVRAVRRDVRSSRDQSASTKTQRSRQPAPNGRRRSATRQLTTSEPSSVEGGGSPEPAGVRESAETCVGVRRGLRVSPQPKSAVVQCSPVQSSAVQSGASTIQSGDARLCRTAQLLRPVSAISPSGRRWSDMTCGRAGVARMICMDMYDAGVYVCVHAPVRSEACWNGWRRVSHRGDGRGRSRGFVVAHPQRGNREGTLCGVCNVRAHGRANVQLALRLLARPGHR